MTIKSHRERAGHRVILAALWKLTICSCIKIASGPPQNFLDMPLLKYGRKIHLRRKS